MFMFLFTTLTALAGETLSTTEVHLGVQARPNNEWSTSGDTTFVVDPEIGVTHLFGASPHGIMFMTSQPTAANQWGYWPVSRVGYVLSTRGKGFGVRGDVSGSLISPLLIATLPVPEGLDDTLVQPHGLDRFSAAFMYGMPRARVQVRYDTDRLGVGLGLNADIHMSVVERPEQVLQPFLQVGGKF